MEHTLTMRPEAFLDAKEMFLPPEVGPEPLAAVARALRQFDRAQLGNAFEVLIALMDATDGDLDLEPNGDELDGSAGEDDFCPHSNGDSPAQ